MRRSMGGSTTLGVCLTTVFLLGCSLRSLSGLAGQDDEPRSDGMSTEAGAESGAPTGERGDAAADGALPSRPCPSSEPGVILCEDFEGTDGGLPGGWDSVVNGTLAVEPGIGDGDSHGLHAVQIGVDDTQWATSSGMRRAIDHTMAEGHGLSIALSFTIRALSDDWATVAEITFGETSYGIGAYTKLDCPNAQMCLTWGNPHSDNAIPWASATTLAFGVRHRVDVTIGATAQGVLGRLSIDGNLVRDSPNLSTNPTTIDGINLFIGALYGRTTTDVTIDDIVVRRITL